MSDADNGYYDADATSSQLDMMSQFNADMNNSVNSFFGVPSIGDIMDKGLDLIGQGLGAIAQMPDQALNMVSGGMSSMASSLGDSVMGMLSGQDKKAESDNKSSSPSPEGMQNIMSNSGGEGGGSELIEEATEVIAENPEILLAL